MSVYTHVTADDIESLLQHYTIGSLQHFTGIEGGVENTNYFIDVESPDGRQTRYVLTLFEYLTENSLPFFINFTTELKAGGLSVPAPVRDNQGRALHRLREKPCLISPCIPGEHIDVLDELNCQQIGHQLANIHLIGQESSLKQENQRGLAWLDRQVSRLAPLISKADAELMHRQWQEITSELKQYDQLPEGLIHGDLFYDNVLFDDGHITGIIDFYNACHDWLLYDVAVTVNDWCLNEDLSLNDNRLTALTRAYTSIRPFTVQEKQAWPVMLRLAAFRFWISRIITFVHPEQAIDKEHQANQVLDFKDPDEFKKILILRGNKSMAGLI